VPEPAKIRALVEKGYLRQIDIAPILGVVRAAASSSPTLAATARQDSSLRGRLDGPEGRPSMGQPLWVSV